MYRVFSAHPRGGFPSRVGLPNICMGNCVREFERIGALVHIALYGSVSFGERYRIKGKLGDKQKFNRIKTILNPFLVNFLVKF